MSSSPRILSIYGTRPEAIKMAPLIKAIEADSTLESVVLAESQHRGNAGACECASKYPVRLCLNIMA